MSTPAVNAAPSVTTGERIAVHVSRERPGPGVDTPDDLARVRAIFAAG